MSAFLNTAYPWRFVYLLLDCRKQTFINYLSETHFEFKQFTHFDSFLDKERAQKRNRELSAGNCNATFNNREPEKSHRQLE